MSGKQIFWAIFILLIVIRSPQIVNELINGALNLFQVNPHG